MMIDIKKIWIEQESSSGKNVVRQRVTSINNISCYIGLIGTTGAKMFQMELDKSIGIHKNYLHKFKGVEIQAIPKGLNYREFTIILIDKALTDIFTLFIEDIIIKLEHTSDPKEALTLINQRINYWKQLFARVSGEILSSERQRGLFGELFFLRLLLHKSEDKETILNSWQGANNSNQDFVHGSNAVEIKTSKAGNPSVFISNEHQLDYTVWANLYLCLIMVNESAGDQNTLFKLIQEIKSLLSYDITLVKDFEVKLNHAGISDDMIEYYNELSYSIRNLRYFGVKDGFPAIIRNTLNNEAIYSVKYQIDIKSCHTFEVSEGIALKNML